MAINLTSREHVRVVRTLRFLVNITSRVVPEGSFTEFAVHIKFVKKKKISEIFQII